MPITVRYEPAAQVVADAAFLGGLGEYRRWLAEQQARQAQQQLAQQELAQRDLAQRRQIAANLYGDMVGNQFAMARQQQAQQFQFDRDKLGREWDLADQNFKARQEKEAFDREARLKREFFQDELGLKRELAKADDEARRIQLGMLAEQQAGTWSDRVRDNLQRLQSSGFEIDQAAYQKAWSDYTKAMGASGMSADQKWLAASEARRRVEQVLENAKPVPKPPTKEEDFDAKTMIKTLPDGREEVWKQGPMRNGSATWEYSHTREAPDGGFGAWLDRNLNTFKKTDNSDNHVIDMEAAEKVWLERQKRIERQRANSTPPAAPAQGQPAAPTPGQPAPPQGQPPAPPSPPAGTPAPAPVPAAPPAAAQPPIPPPSQPTAPPPAPASSEGQPAPAPQGADATAAPPKPPQGMAFPYQNPNRQPIPVIPRHVPKERIPVGQPFMDPDTGLVYVINKEGQLRVVPPAFFQQ